MEITNSVGRRKAAIARVFVKKGTGQISINDRPLENYLPSHLQLKVRKPLELTNFASDFDLKINVSGGGIKGQAEAIMLGVARAIDKINPDSHSVLKVNRLLTRDSRVVERKKPGLRKARKSDQFSKR